MNAGRWPPRCSPKNGLLKSAPSTETLLWMPFWPLIADLVAVRALHDGHAGRELA